MATQEFSTRPKFGFGFDPINGNSDNVIAATVEAQADTRDLTFKNHVRPSQYTNGNENQKMTESIPSEPMFVDPPGDLTANASQDQLRTADINDPRRGNGGPPKLSRLTTITEAEMESADLDRGQRGQTLTSAASSYSACTASSSQTSSRDGKVHEKNPLTIEGALRMDAVLKRKEKSRSSYSGLLPVVKWVMTGVLMVVLLASLVASKLSVLVLAVQLNETRSPSGAQAINYTAQFIVLYVYLSVPPLLMLLRSIWSGLLNNTVPWPCRKASLLAVLSAALESTGLCLMCYTVLGRYPAPLSLLLLVTILVVPAINTIFIVRNFRRQGLVRARTLVFVAVGAVCLLASSVCVVVVLLKEEPVDSRTWHLAIAVLCLNIAWLPSLQSYITTSAVADDVEKNVQERNFAAYGTFTTSHRTNIVASGSLDSGSSALHSGALNRPDASSPHSSQYGLSSLSSKSTNMPCDPNKSAGWKTSFIVNLCRLLFLFLVSCILLFLDSGFPPADIQGIYTEAWDLGGHIHNRSTWLAEGIGLGAGFLAYGVAFVVCHMSMAVGALAPPLLLATPLSLVAMAMRDLCPYFLPDSTCSWEEAHTPYLVPSVVLFVVGYLLTFGWYLFRADPVLLQQENVVFCVPGYNCVALDTWLTINRRNDANGALAAAAATERKGGVFICTTMYREEENEMRQLLESIRRINECRTGDRCFESHIFFDNGVRQKELSEFALTLISLLDETLDIQQKGCTKVITPYGMKLSWALSSPHHSHKMAFNIHLKDNLLVKNKKRWSQVMYMSYVLDFLTEDEDAFILTTDADVVFTPESVEALLDLMTRDSSLGAACARTHPMGNGPLVWYQVFEYAIGHWFQKTAEHVLGSVLCAPGCFSMYRCRALADVLPKYAKRVETAFDFLTKDMGEDRWLCTLLVQSGWRIEYCAASENSTNCPSEFDEFYKQRRRWIASTLANLMLIIKEWKYVHYLNKRVSVLFLVYQGLLLFSTLIGPSTVMLVVSGGLVYAWGVDVVAALVLQLLACMLYALLCIFTSQSKQLMVAKVYTFIYAIVMTAVAVGTAVQIVDDLRRKGGSSSHSNANITTSTTTAAPTQDVSDISISLPMSITTLYFSILVGIFVLAGLLHPTELYCLLHGIWYLLCLPSGYLVLTIYSICNITDSSWGTREQAAEKSSVKKEPWQHQMGTWFRQIFFCCQPKPGAKQMMEKGVQTLLTRSSSLSLSLSEDQPLSPAIGIDDNGLTASSASTDIQQDIAQETATYDFASEMEPVPVEEWLPLEMRDRCAHLFKKHGFDSTLFIAGMTETDLRRIDITSRGHLHYLLSQIAFIPAFEIEYKVPTNVDEWLAEIGLSMYRDNFRRNHIRQPKEMEILKSFGRREIERELGIKKDGHIKRLKYAISMLRDPTEAQQKAMRMRQVIEETPIHNLGESNVGENDFWEELKAKCLQPDLKAFGLEGEVKAKLADLRNNWLLILAVSNTLWLILISTLASSSQLTVLGANPLGLVFLVIFGFLLVLQFLTMLLHRLYTLTHYLARAPYRCGRPKGGNASAFISSFPAKSDFDETSDWAAVVQFKKDSRRALERMTRRKASKRSRTLRDPDTEQCSDTKTLVN